jgi:hypothetical protein
MDASVTGATASTSAEVPDEVSISIYVVWASLWLEIAEAHVQLAREAREAMPGGESLSTPLVTAEFHASLTAIAASAFAVEAAIRAVAIDVPHRDGVNKGSRIGDVLFGMGRISLPQAKQLERLFDLRNEAVHPTHGWNTTPLPMHPSGLFQCSAAQATYTLEAAVELTQAAREVVETIPGPGGQVAPKQT